MVTKAKQTEYTKQTEQMINFMANTLANIEHDLKRVKTILHKLQTINPYDEATWDILQEAKKAINPNDLKTYSDEDVEVVEGLFNGYFMVGADQKKYPVPLNYSSKTKLVSGDKLKLKVHKDGKLIYKLIGPVERKHQKAVISLGEDGKYIALTDEGKTYFLNQAAVSYFKAIPGDELYIITNVDETSTFAALEAVIKK